MSEKSKIKGAGTALVHALTGMVVPIPPVFVHMTGSLTSAYLLRQIIHLSTSHLHADKNGWFHKSADEWQAELGLSRFQVDAAIKGTKKTMALALCGVETKCCKPVIDGKPGPSPVLHYRINLQVLENALATHYEYTEGKTDFQETSKSHRRDIEETSTPDFQETSSSYYIKRKESKRKDSPADAGDAPETPKPPTPAQIENGRVYDIAKVLASYHTDWQEPEPRSITIWRGKGSEGTAGQVAKLFPELTPELFEQFLRDYEQTCSNCEKLAQADTIKQRLDKWLRTRPKSDDEIRSSPQWQAHRAIYEAYAAAWKGTKTLQQILNEDFKGVYTYVKIHGATA